MKVRLLINFILITLSCTASSAARSQEVFIGNPGKSLNFFHFDLALEKGYFKELGLDVKLLNTKCDVAVTALLTAICRRPAASARRRVLSPARTCRCAR